MERKEGKRAKRRHRKRQINEYIIKNKIKYKGKDILYLQAFQFFTILEGI